MFLNCAAFKDLYLFQEIALLNPCLKFSGNSMLLFIEYWYYYSSISSINKYSLVLFVWNAVDNIHVAGSASVNRLATELAVIEAVLASLDHMQFPNYGRLTSILQLIKGKPRHFRQKLLQ